MNLKPYSRIPILLSAFVCPGLGQFVQKRWFAGLFFFLGFIIGFIKILWACYFILSESYRMAMEFDTYAGSETVDYKMIIGPLIFACVFYLLNLIDMALNRIHLKHQEREEAFAQSTITMMQALEKTEPLTPADESANSASL